MKKTVMIAGMICCLAGTASAQGAGFTAGGGAEPNYPANPQYQYPYPYNARTKALKTCPQGQVRHQGKCKPGRLLALPF